MKVILHELRHLVEERVPKMSVAVLRAYSPEENNLYGNNHSFSIVVTDTSVKYVFNNEKQEKQYDQRIERILKILNIEKPKKIEQWLDVVTFNMGDIKFTYEELDISAKKSINLERKTLEALKEEVQSFEGIYSKRGQSLMRESMVYNELAASDPEFVKFVNGEEMDEVPQSYKEYIQFLIQEAGTEDLNPWLDAWMNGEDIDDLDLSRGVVLDPVFYPKPIDRNGKR